MDVAVWIELVEFDGFDGDCGGGAEDGFFGGGAGDLGGGSGEAHDELAVVLCAGDVLEELEGDVCGVEAGEDEDVCSVAFFGAGEFDFRGFGVECDVRLDFAFDFDV